jgi:hypothetical protein
MKKWGILLLAALVAMFVMVSCEQPVDKDFVGFTTTKDCAQCHVDRTNGAVSLVSQTDLLTARSQYNESGHANGARVLTNATSGLTGEIFAAEGGNANYCNSGDTTTSVYGLFSGTTPTLKTTVKSLGCSKCHTDNGFVTALSNGGVSVDSAGDQPGCFTCHDPHNKGTMAVRTVAPVTLIATSTTFDGGTGNLCANCHQARTPATVAATADPLTSGVTPGIWATDSYTQTTLNALTVPTTVLTTDVPAGTPGYLTAAVYGGLQTWGSSTGTHHGPQSNFINGEIAATTAPVSGSAYAASTVHSNCATCHYWAPAAGRAGVSLDMGGHGTYLQSSVHGSKTDYVAACQSCHAIAADGATAVASPATWPTDSYGKSKYSTFITAQTSSTAGVIGGHIVATDIDGDGVRKDILAEIQGMKKTLLGYLGASANFRTVTTATVDVTAATSGLAVKTKAYHSYSIAAAAVGGSPVLPTGSVADYSPGGSTDWNKDWVFNSGTVYLAKFQAQALWNFKYFMEDRSMGIHNPTFAARLLYDAIALLNANGTTLTIGTRP